METQWTTVIKPKASLLSVDFGELWQYRDFYRMFVKRDIVTWYKQTILGPLWFFIQPIMTTVMFMVVFGSLTTKYRDLTFLLTFIVQLWMYATPVIYPLSTIEDPRLKTLMQANPLTSIMETFKFGMLGVGEFSWTALGYTAGFAVGILALGIIVFNKIQRTFMDTV